jgi:hypothetical protein
MSLIALAQAASVVDETPCPEDKNEKEIVPKNIDETSSCTTNPTDLPQNVGTETPV